MNKIFQHEKRHNLIVIINLLPRQHLVLARTEKSSPLVYSSDYCE